MPWDLPHAAGKQDVGQTHLQHAKGGQPGELAAGRCDAGPEHERQQYHSRHQVIQRDQPSRIEPAEGPQRKHHSGIEQPGSHCP